MTPKQRLTLVTVVIAIVQLAVGIAVQGGVGFFAAIIGLLLYHKSGVYRFADKQLSRQGPRSVVLSLLSPV